MVRKLGYHPEDQDELQRSIDIFIEKDLLLVNPEQTQEENLWPQICVMSSNRDTADYTDCMAHYNRSQTVGLFDQ